MPVARMLAGRPQAPPALPRILADLSAAHPQRSVVEAFSRDPDCASTYLFVTRRFLPGRRMGSVREAVALLGDTLALRLAVLGAAVHWMRALLPHDPSARPLLRHVIATAVGAEALARESRATEPPARASRVAEPEPLFCYAAALFHHLGDFVLLAAREDAGDGTAQDPARPVPGGARVGAALLESAGAPSALCRLLLEHEEVRLSGAAGAAPAAQVLAAADDAVTGFGYAAPLHCAEPRREALLTKLAQPLQRARDRVGSSIEDALAAVFDLEDRAAQALAHARVVTQAVRGAEPPPAEEAGSARDLGPLPVLFARITDARDLESVEAAFAAGLVEELGAARAWYVRLQKESAALHGGVLCARGNVPLPLKDVEVKVQDLPKALRGALASGKPTPHQGALPALAKLAGDTEGRDTVYLPVTAARDVFGLLALELDEGASISLDLLAAVAAHVGLAMHATQLQKLSQEATTDALTGLFNRRGILEALDKKIEEARASSGGLGLALIDCDHLKLVNDNFGHLMGDEFLRRISEVVRNSMRACDVLGRYGGDEFLAVLPGVDETSLAAALERARAEVEQVGLQSTDGLLLSVSIGGVVCRGLDCCSREELLRAADAALYRVKQGGRNRVEIAAPLRVG